MQIAVCDDKERVCIELVNVINRVLEKQGISGEVRYYTSGLELLKEIDRFQLVFLDMDMPVMDGMEVGEEIEIKNPDCRIVIASSREDRFKETYRINPLRFVSKPFKEEEVADAVEAYIEKAIGYTEMEVFKDRISYWFRQRDIQYIASFRGYVEIMVNGDIYRKDVSLKQIEEQLEEKLFFKVHKSYIVNMLWVSKIMKNEVMVGKVAIPISRRQRKDFEDEYINFDIRYR